MHEHPRSGRNADWLHPRALAIRPYDKGLHDLGSGTFAYLQPNGSWGWSNTGLIVDGDEALLVDTLFDLHLTREMLAAMRSADRRAERIGTVVNTHANPDHTHGNSLLPDAQIIASVRAAGEMAHENPAMLAGLLRKARQSDDPVSRYFVECFGAFDFEGIPPTAATRAFSGRLDLTVGTKRIELIELGSAHTGGDIVIHVPDDGVIYAGDLLFVGGHPIMWAGPIGNWIAACDHLLSLNARYIVPGHGPVTDARGIRAVRDYLAMLDERATAAYRAGVAVVEAARDIANLLDRAGYESWCDAERVLATVSGVYRQLQGDQSVPNPAAMFAAMAEFKAAQERILNIGASEASVREGFPGSP